MQAKLLRFSNVISVYISPHVLCSSDAYAYPPFPDGNNIPGTCMNTCFGVSLIGFFCESRLISPLNWLICILFVLVLVHSGLCTISPYIFCALDFFVVVASPLTLCDIISFPHVSFTLCLVTCDEGQDDAVFFFNEYYEEQIMWTTTAIATTTINNNPAPKKAGPPHTTTRYVLEIKLFRKS